MRPFEGKPKINFLLHAAFQFRIKLNQDLLFLCYSISISEDGCWYRAMIVSVQNKSIEVTFVDFGNSTELTANEIRPIYSEFMKLPAQVFVCSLADIEPKEKSWTLQAINSFENMTLDKHLAAYVKSKSKFRNI